MDEEQTPLPNDNNEAPTVTEEADAERLLSHGDIAELGLISHEQAIDMSETLFSAVKELRSASLKVLKKQQEEEEARQMAKALQHEVNTILDARLQKQDTSHMRSAEKVQKEVLKAHNKVDRAIDSVGREKDKAEEAYLRLMTLVVTP